MQAVHVLLRAWFSYVEVFVYVPGKLSNREGRLCGGEKPSAFPRVHSEERGFPQPCSRALSSIAFQQYSPRVMRDMEPLSCCIS